MKFTEYFSTILNDYGVPNMDVKHYKIMLNIITVEARINELTSQIIDLPNSDAKSKLKLRLRALKLQLNRLSFSDECQRMFEAISEDANLKRASK